MNDNEKRLTDALGKLQTVIAEALESIKKPLLADAQVGWLCKRRDGKYMEIDEIDTQFPSLTPAYRCGMGWWTQAGCSVHNQTLDIISCEPLAEVGSAEWAWQMLMLGIKMWHPSEQSMETSAMTKDGFVRCHAKTGWQIYEPVEPAPRLKVGDWVETDLPYEDIDENIYHCKVHDVISNGELNVFIPSIGRWEWIKPADVIRILPKSEVRVTLSLEGTVVMPTLPITGNTRFQLMVNGTSYIIYYSDLTPADAEMVRGLVGEK